MRENTNRRKESASAATAAIESAFSSIQSDRDTGEIASSANSIANSPARIASTVGIGIRFTRPPVGRERSGGYGCPRVSPKRVAMDRLLPFAMLAVRALPFALDLRRHELDRQQVCAAARAFGVTITANFLTAPCTRCEQRDMGLLSVNANGSAIHYECRHCQKKLYA